MFNNDSCPVTHVSLFRKLQDLVVRGEVSLQDVYRAGFGPGQKYVHNGTPLKFRMNYAGRMDWLENPPADLDPSATYDFAYAGQTLVAYAKSL